MNSGMLLKLGSSSPTLYVILCQPDLIHMMNELTLPVVHHSSTLCVTTVLSVQTKEQKMGEGGNETRLC